MIRFKRRNRLMAIVRRRLKAEIRRRLKAEIRRRLKATPSPSSQCLQMAKNEEAQTRNFVFSPWSIHLSLSLLANGSNGTTKHELLTFLQAESLEDLNSCNKELLNSWTRPDDKTAAFVNSHNQRWLEKLTADEQEGPFVFTESSRKELVDRLSRIKPYEAIPVLTFVGGIWVDKSVTLNPIFKSIAEDIYQGRAETVEFEDKMKHKEIIDGVNKWAEEATNGVIKSVLSEDYINESTRFVLASALYFRKGWAKTFRKSFTKERKFYLLDGSSVNVPFMSSNEDRCIYASNKFKILRLPYDMSSISIYIILPRRGKSLLTLLHRVISDPSFIERYKPKLVKVGNLRIPKFKVSYEFEMSSILQGVGVRSCFSHEAGFDEMVMDLKDRDVFKSSQVIHRSHIEIDEEGTVAAAATMFDLQCSLGGVITAPVNFVADHPFIFMIRDDKSGTVLFMGHVVNPLLKCKKEGT